MKKGAVILAVLSLVVSLSSVVQADSIQAWGYNAVSQLGAPAGNDFIAIAFGDSRWVASTSASPNKGNLGASVSSTSRRADELTEEPKLKCAGGVTT
jgi:hypothetical protein